MNARPYFKQCSLADRSGRKNISVQHPSTHEKTCDGEHRSSGSRYVRHVTAGKLLQQSEVAPADIMITPLRHSCVLVLQGKTASRLDMNLPSQDLEGHLHHHLPGSGIIRT